MKKTIKQLFSSYQEFYARLIYGLQRMLEVFGQKAFLLILLLVLFSVIFSEFLLYKYVISVEIRNPSDTPNITEFNKKTYESVVKEWQRRENIFNSTNSEDYPTPFQ